MGKHLQVPCEKCQKKIRSDNMKRHLKTCDGSGQKCMPYRPPAALIEKLESVKANMPPAEVRDKELIFKFQSKEINLGNMTQRNAFNALLKKAFRKLLTPELLTEKVDGVERVSEDTYCKPFLDYYLPNRQEFEEYRFYHMICLDEDLENVKKDFDIMGPTCRCNCNRFKYLLAANYKLEEDGTTRYEWNDVSHLFEDKEMCHWHFVLKVPKSTMPDKIQRAVRDVVEHKRDCRLMRNLPGHCWTLLDLARVLLYIQRSENTKGFCTHFDHDDPMAFPVGGWRIPTSSTAKYVTPPENGVVETLEKIANEERQWWTRNASVQDFAKLAKLNCNYCRKVRKTPVCNQHMYMYNKYVENEINDDN